MTVSRSGILALAASVVATCAFAAGASAQTQPDRLEPGDILVVDPGVPPVSTAVLFGVDPETGARTVLQRLRRERSQLGRGRG